MEFSNLLELEKYVGVAYDVENRSYPPYFQVQFIVVNFNSTDLSEIKISVKKENVSKKALERSNIFCTKKGVTELRANIFGSQKHY